MIVKKLTTSRLLNDVQQCTPQWGVQATERSCDSKMAEFHSDKFAFAKLPTQTCVCKMIPRFAPAKRGFLLPVVRPNCRRQGPNSAKCGFCPLTSGFNRAYTYHIFGPCRFAAGSKGIVCNTIKECGIMKNNNSIKTVVAVGIGAALFFVLGRFVAIPSPVPNTNISLQYAVLALLAAMYGPVAGGLIGWIVVAPVLDILIYAEPAKKVFAQGVFAGISNSITAVVVGGLLVLAYTKTIAKKGSLDKE